MRTAEQTEMFQGRGSDGPRTEGGPGFYFFASTTWMFRRAFMDDFKIRAACPRFLFRIRRCTPIVVDGVHQEWVVTRRIEGKDNRGYPKEALYHVQGPDGKRMTQPKGTRFQKLPDGREVSGGGPAVTWDPVYEEFPSHRFAGQGPFPVQGDDGSVWALGSRGNAIPVLVEEVTHFAMLWPNEKLEMLKWLHGDRKLLVDANVAGEKEAVDDLIRTVDHYYSDQIQTSNPDVTEAEISASGLPDYVIENLVCNLRNYKKLRVGCDDRS